MTRQFRREKWGKNGHILAKIGQCEEMKGKGMLYVS